LRVQNCPFDESEGPKSHAGVLPFAFWYNKLGSSHFSNHCRKVSSGVGREESGDVFDDGPSGSPEFPAEFNDSHCFKEESTSCTFQTGALAGHTKVLTGKPKDNSVYGADR
jgi:hypothetical protein